MAIAPLMVTVSARVLPASVALATERAAAWGLPYYRRRRLAGLTNLLGVEAEAFLVHGDDGWTLRDQQGELRFTPGMATLRIKRRQSGQGKDDVLLRLLEVRPGDVIVDATAGLCVDALVLAHAVGATGRVIALESSLPLCALVGEGLKRMTPFANSAPVELLNTDSLTWLKSMKDGSVDGVYFDPMFSRPGKSTERFGLMRRWANHSPVTVELFNEARRVARRWVVVKGGRYGTELDALGLKLENTSRSRPTVWGRAPSFSEGRGPG